MCGKCYLKCADTVDNTSIFYIVSDKKIIGAINKKDLSLDISISLNKNFIFNFDHRPSSDEINKIFIEVIHDGIVRDN